MRKFFVGIKGFWILGNFVIATRIAESVHHVESNHRIFFRETLPSPSLTPRETRLGDTALLGDDDVYSSPVNKVLFSGWVRGGIQGQMCLNSQQ